MAGIDEALKALASGQIDVNEAATQIRAAMDADTSGARPAPEDAEFGDSAMTRFADRDDEGYDASFNKVSAAWIGGTISDGQYHTIREAVLPQQSAESKSAVDKLKDKTVTQPEKGTEVATKSPEESKKV